MIERQIYTALDEGLTAILAEPARLRVFLERTLRLARAEATEIIELMLAHRPRIIHAFPRREESTFPLWAISLIDERESKRFLNNYTGLADSDFLGSADARFVESEMIGSQYITDIGVYTIAANPDTCHYFYQLSKYILTNARQSLVAGPILDIGFSGSDLSPELQYLPQHLFSRRLMVAVTHKFEILGERSPIIRDIEGLHIDGPRISDVRQYIDPTPSAED